MATVELHGVRYRVERSGAGAPIVLLHGFTGSTASWGEQLPALHRAGWETIAVDQLGHCGTDSPGDPERYRADAAVRDLAALLDVFRIERAVWLGYSMGARLGLSVAVERPERVRVLVLESGSPGIAEPEARAARAASDEALAASIERDRIESFVAHWESLPMFATHARLDDDTRLRLRRQRLANEPRGLANSLRGFGQGTQPYLGDRLDGLAMPVCLIAGAEDEKYARLAGEMAGRLRDVELTIVEGCGHTPHLERPAEFDRIVTAFLATAEERGA
jgi:2-succinyl-6-hydroxy-2,4-cyclohexadiene-1-carboxylate synthase